MEMLNKDLSFLVSLIDDIALIKTNHELFFTIFQKFRNNYNLSIMGGAIMDRTKENIKFIIGKDNDNDNGKINDSDLYIQDYLINNLPFEFSLTKQGITQLEVSHFYLMQPLKKDQPSLQSVFTQLNINSLLLIPMKTSGVLIGFLIFAEEEYQLKKKDYDYTLKIANLIGSAVNNLNAFLELRDKEREKEIQIKFLIDLVTIKENSVLYSKLAKEIDKLIPCDYLAIFTKEAGSSISKVVSLKKEMSGSFKIIPHTQIVNVSIALLKSQADTIDGANYSIISGDELDNFCKQSSHIKQIKEKYFINSLLVLQYAYENLGQLSIIVGRKTKLADIRFNEQIELLITKSSNEYFANHEINLGLNLLPQIGLILGNLYAFEEIRSLTKKLEQEKNFLLEEVNLSNSFQEIIGNSQVIQTTLNKIKQVAPLDVTVLILGETGTGKELIAKAVHNLSKRKDNTFITVNCAALPAQLIESELFGHEKGSFTGAIEKRIGKFEVADGGTIFLDEIGELPLEIQAKLLRVLQEKEFERLGGKSTIHTDVRIIAATNRNLENEIAHGKFRSDLFFRLNVFPITSPPLRERIDDIPLLVKHFIIKVSKKIGKGNKNISKNDLETLLKYNWPGNVRELEHMIERAMITSESSKLNFENILSSVLKKNENSIESFKTLTEIEKEHIINALKISNGKVTGENSAAQLLGINGKTLGSRMRKFGIKREVVITTEKK